MSKRATKPKVVPLKEDDPSGELIPFTDHQIQYMDELRRTGLYGPTLAHVINGLVLEGLRRAAANGLVPKITR